MKPNLTAVLVAMGALLIACDPGMTIRQIKSLGDMPKEALVPSPQIAIKVETEHQLIGESFYQTRVWITDWFDLPVTITSIELIARGNTYVNKPPPQEIYPLVVLPRQTESRFAVFTLNDDVKEIFRKPAELCVHYRVGGKEKIAGAVLVGGPPNRSMR